MISEDTGEVLFCYLPGYQKPLRSSLQEFMEYLIKNASQESREDALLLYGLYRKSCEYTVTPKVLAEFLRSNKLETGEMAAHSFLSDETQMLYEDLGLSLPPGTLSSYESSHSYVYNAKNETNDEDARYNQENEAGKELKLNTFLQKLRPFYFEAILLLVTVLAIIFIVFRK